MRKGKATEGLVQQGVYKIGADNQALSLCAAILLWCLIHRTFFKYPTS